MASPLTVEIAVDGAAPPPGDVVQEASELCEAHLERPVRLRVITRLVMQSEPEEE